MQTTNDYFQQLKSLVEAVNASDDSWIAHLREEFDNFENDAEAEAKISILSNLDNAVYQSFQTPPVNVDAPNQLAVDALSGLVIELEGYRRLSQRYFSDLRKLSETDRLTQTAADNARKALFRKVEEVQRWLEQQNRPIKPSDFDTCTEQFLARLDPASRERTLTEQLFSNRRLDLNDAELNRLISAWGEAVSSFIRDAQDTDDDRNSRQDRLDFGESDTIANFLCIHDRLETLYGRLATNVRDR